MSYIWPSSIGLPRPLLNCSNPQPDEAVVIDDPSTSLPNAVKPSPSPMTMAWLNRVSCYHVPVYHVTMLPCYHVTMLRWQQRLTATLDYHGRHMSYCSSDISHYSNILFMSVVPGVDHTRVLRQCRLGRQRHHSCYDGTLLYFSAIATQHVCNDDLKCWRAAIFVNTTCQL